MLKPKYSLLIVSYISLYKKNGAWYTLDLWVRDLIWNRNVVTKLCLLAPQSTATTDKLSKLPSDITVVTFDEVSSKHTLEELISAYEVIQINGGRPFWQSRENFRVIKIAKSKKKCVICGISSDRARTTILNSQGSSFFKKVKAQIQAWSILNTSKKLALASDGLFLVGFGLTKRLSFNHRNLHVSTASWISSEDIISDDLLQRKIMKIRRRQQLKLCVATRLEVMKGVKVAIEALALVKTNLKENIPLLFIYGEGPEKDKLESLCKHLCIEEQVSFMGTVPYGQPFFEEISKYELMLLTNLNDEQPRLIFDALSQGMIPICPDSDAYSVLDLDKSWYYKTGHSQSLFKKIMSFNDKDFLINSLNQAKSLSKKYTIGSMHLERANWIERLLKQANFR